MGVVAAWERGEVGAEWEVSERDSARECKETRLLRRVVLEAEDQTERRAARRVAVPGEIEGV